MYSLNPKYRPPVRKVNHRGSLRVTGRFVSLKMGRVSVPWESLLERSYIHILEYSKSIVAYNAQSSRDQYMQDGVEHVYFPDFNVERISAAEEIHEVKPYEEVNNDFNRRKFAAIQRQYDAQNKTFRIFTDSWISKGNRVENIESIFRYQFTKPHPSEYFRILDLFDSQDSVSIGQLMTGHFGKEFSKSTIYAMLAVNMLEMDIFGNLDSSTILTVNPEHSMKF